MGNMIQIETIFSDIFDSLRGTGSISLITQISVKSYEVTTDNTDNLVVGDYVYFTNTDGLTKSGYRVTSIPTSTAFRVLVIGTIVLGAFGTWINKSWYYLPAITTELSNKITIEQTSKLTDVVPCAWLVEGFNVEKTNDIRFEYIIPSLRLVLFNRSKQDLSTVERLANNYTSIIDPFFDRLIIAMSRNVNLYRALSGFDYTFTNNVMYDNTINKNKLTLITDAKIIDFSNIQIIKTNC